MKRFNGGSKVPGGWYWNQARWDVATISGAEGVLEGDAAETFVKVPLLVMIPLAAIVSFGFVVFLPFIGFALFAYAVAKKVAGLLTGVAKEAAVTMSPGLLPGEAHLAGKAAKENDKEEKTPDALAELKKEIDEARREEK